MSPPFEMGPPGGVDFSRPVWAEISAGALLRNLGRLQQAAGAGVPVLAVVKANGYGHGTAGCAAVLAGGGAPWLGVTDVVEGTVARRALGILPQTMNPRVLVMCGVWPGDEAECLQNQLTPVVWEMFHLQLLEREAERRGLPPGSVAVHLEVDTGMARQGVVPGAWMGEFLRQLALSPRLRLEGVFTHFASAECPEDVQNSSQREMFLEGLRQVRDAGLRPSLVHAGNTSGIDSGVLDPWLADAAKIFGARPMVRAGLGLYGYALPLAGLPLGDAGFKKHLYLPGLEPVMSWKTRVGGLRDVPAGASVGYNATYIAPRPMRLALLPVGYADGLRRALSSTGGHAGGDVLLRGRRVPLIGRVSMDLSVVDVSGLGEVSMGEEIVLLGRQGGEAIDATEHAGLAGTIVYEVLCGIGARVPRTMVD